MKIILEIIVLLLASINLLLTRFALFRLHQPTTPLVWMIKVFVSALSPVLLLTGIVTTFLGWLLAFTPTIIIGGLSSVFYLIHIIAITRAPDSSTGFEKIFGEFENNFTKERSSRFLSSRYVFRLRNSPNPILTQNIPFYTIANSDRELLCDIWQPPQGVTRSGLTFIYLHGSAWTLLDKDCGTRTFFRHLTAQGHTVMDVAYRLFPETDFMGMVHDVKHAIAWMKANAAKYGATGRVVIGGGSAGAHLSLLAAYTNQNTELTPPDLINVDVSVHGVVSLYGQSDLSMTFYHTAQHLVSHSSLAQKKGNESGGMPMWVQKKMGADFHRLGFDKNVEPGMLRPMLGGSPNEIPEAYARFSPISYVHKDCPTTLIIHGDQDILAPLVAIKALKKHLRKVGVPVVVHIVPQTDHAFDLILPKISPSAHNALYDVERFLALLV